MNWRAIAAVIRRDLKVVLRSKAVVVPLIVVPLIMQVLLPAGIGLGITYFPESGEEELEDLQMMFDNMPGAIRAELDGLEVNQVFFFLMVTYLFAPMFLIVPLMVSSVIAADSFAGEKERKTLEALLHTPLSDQELVVGKLLSALLPALAVTVISFVLYTVVVNAVGWPLMGRIFFPNAMWYVLVFWVAPAASAMGLGATVLVSSKVKTFQEAYQMGGMVVIPIVALMFGQITGVLFLSVGVVFIVGALVWLIDAILIGLAVGTLRRSELIANL